MLHRILALVAAAGLVAGTALAAPPKKAAPKKPKAPAKVVDVYTCPVTEGKVTGQGSGTRTVGNYRVHFCCAGCDTEWDKWTEQKKLATAKKLAAKEAAAKKSR